MNDPKISVVMPVHNAGRFLDEAIRSILDQTFVDFEFVLLNDGSTDGSGQALREWAARDDRIRLFENERRLGHSVTSNRAVSMARARYVARMDADDISHPERLSREWQVLSQSKDIVLVGTLADGIDALGKWVRPRDRWRIARRSGFAPFPHGSVIFRKEVFEAVGGYEGSATNVGDHDLFHRMARHGRLVTLAEVLYHYRYHLANSSLKRLAVSSGIQNGNHSADSPYLEGAMRLWAGHSPGILEKLRAEGLAWNSQGLMTAILAGWGEANPSSLRACLRSWIWLRDQLAGIWIKNGKAYDWRVEECAGAENKTPTSE